MKVCWLRTIHRREESTDPLKYYFVCQIVYKAAVCLTKVSLLLLYLRIFPARAFRIAVWVVVAIVVGSATGTVVATIFQCNPLQKSWHSILPGHCIKIGGVWYSSSSLAIFTDVRIIVLPITQIPSLTLPKGQKIGLGFLFSLGIL